MTFESAYLKGKKELLNDSSINQYNRNLMKQFFEEREERLEQNKIGKKFAVLDEKNFKTLGSFIGKFRNVNTWLDNIELKESEEFEKSFKEFFKKFISGKILKKNKEPLQDVDFYIGKIFRGEDSLFILAGLREIVKRVTKNYRSNNEVIAEWIEEKNVESIIDNSQGIYKILYQVGWDFGENFSALILTKKSDYKMQYNEVTKENEYLLTLRKEILKRSRKARTEPTRFKRTAELLESHLKELKDNDFVFCRDDSKVGENDKNKGKNIPMSLRSVEKHFDKIVEKLKIKTQDNKKPTTKHIRSSMACDLLRKGWSCEEINSRLGHELNSQVLKPYLNSLALDKQKPKIREYKENIQGLNEKITEQKNVNILMEKRLEELKKKDEERDKIIKILWNSIDKKKGKISIGDYARVLPR